MLDGHIHLWNVKKEKMAKISKAAIKAAKKKIDDKLKEAAKALKEASEIAKQDLNLDTFINSNYDYDEDNEDTDLKDELNINYQTLYDAMDNAGWQTSSFDC